MYKLFSNAYARMRYLRFRDMRPFLNKVFNVSLSFLMIFTLAFVSIETIDPEPAEATTAFPCTDDSSRGVIYRMTYENGGSGSGVQMKIYSYNPDNASYSLIRTYYNLPVANNDTASTADINAFSMDDDGNAYIVVRSNNAGTKTVSYTHLTLPTKA